VIRIGLPTGKMRIRPGFSLKNDVLFGHVYPP
jgi:hypothetical protein